MYRYALITAVLAAATSARAADPVELELAGLADDVAKVLAKQDQKEIRLGKFTGDGDIPSNFGPEIQRVLAAEFGKRKIAVNKDALVEIKGEYAPATSDPGAPDSKLMFVRVNARLVNTKTRLDLANVSIASRAVYGNEALAKAFAPTVSLPPDATRDNRNADLRRAIEKPATSAAGTVVRSKPDSPFAVELLVVSDAKAADPVAGRSVAVKDGLAFVEVRKTEYYRVKIHNNAPFDVAVRVSIDGLDQFVFADPEFRGKDGRPRFEYVLVPAGKTAVVRGWFRNLKQADAFVVTEYAKGAVAELNASQADVGQICVQFYAAWERDEDKPRDEPTTRDAATGRGEKVDVNLVPVKRQIGAMRDQVSIRYAK